MDTSGALSISLKLPLIARDTLFTLVVTVEDTYGRAATCAESFTVLCASPEKIQSRLDDLSCSSEADPSFAGAQALECFQLVGEAVLLGTAVGDVRSILPAVVRKASGLDLAPAPASRAVVAGLKHMLPHFRSQGEVGEALDEDLQELTVQLITGLTTATPLDDSFAGDVVTILGTLLSNFVTGSLTRTAAPSETQGTVKDPVKGKSNAEQMVTVIGDVARSLCCSNDELYSSHSVVVQDCLNITYHYYSPEFLPTTFGDWALDAGAAAYFPDRVKFYTISAAHACNHKRDAMRSSAMKKHVVFMNEDCTPLNISFNGSKPISWFLSPFVLDDSQVQPPDTSFSPSPTPSKLFKASLATFRETLILFQSYTSQKTSLSFPTPPEVR